MPRKLSLSRYEQIVLAEIAFEGGRAGNTLAEMAARLYEATGKLVSVPHWPQIIMQVNS